MQQTIKHLSIYLTVSTLLAFTVPIKFLHYWLLWFLLTFIKCQRMKNVYIYAIPFNPALSKHFCYFCKPEK